MEVARQGFSLLPDSLKAKEEGELVNLLFKSTQLGFQLIKLSLQLKMTQQVTKQVCQYTEGVLNI